ncbi:PH domain-containing protein [Glycomyces arizonensis]|uniref:PH domain-containing protein n=1 Tax=Glycomyces arizonensis TaxID=256035 RepID=UPI0003F72B51|nr:PH domain-containing protein [Glycomyces arizonensis]
MSGPADPAPEAAGTDQRPAPPMAPAPIGPPPPPPIESLPRRRLHPLTPLLESFRFFAAVAAAVGLQVFTSRNFLFAVFAAAVAAIGGGIVSLISIQYRGFLIHGTDLHIFAGVLSRSHRTVPLDRLQSVDVVRPIQARVFGLAQLRIEIAGSDGANDRLSYLKHDQALALRSELLAVAGRAPEPTAAADEGQAAPAPETTPLVPTVPVARLAYASFLRWLPVQVVVLLVVGIAFGVSSYFFGAGAVANTLWVGLIAPALVGYLQSTFRTVNSFLRHCRFRLAESERRFLIERGLTDRVHETVPLDRVTTVSVSEPLLWRFKRWRSVEASTASAAQESPNQSAAVSSLLPVGDLEQVGLVASTALPGVPWDRIEIERPPRRVRWRMPLQWGRSGAALDEHAFLVRGGFMVNRVLAVPYARIQWVKVVQGPIQRRQGVATVTAMTAGSAGRHAVAPHRDAAEAVAMAAELRERADAAAAAEQPRLS